LDDASKLVREAQKALWTVGGAGALAYLRGRGLTDESIEAARLGWAPDVSIPVRDGTRYWRVKGIVIPWFESDRLALLKIRRGTREEPKYVEAFRHRPDIYPGPAVVRPGRPLVIVEGEFDAILLGQIIGDLAAVITLGGAGMEATPLTLMRLMGAAPWFVATDADGAGEAAAAKWPTRAIRVKPPSGKDWTESHQNGSDLRRFWCGILAGNYGEVPLMMSREGVIEALTPLLPITEALSPDRAEDPEVLPVEEPEVLPVEEPEVLPVEDPEVLPIEEPEVLPVEDPEVLPIEEPEVLLVEDPERRSIAIVTNRGPRDYRRGDRWLSWH
jgi:hypothetical protein